MELTTVFLYVDERLVGVDDLFEIDRMIYGMGERRAVIVIMIQPFGFFACEVAVGVDRRKYATGEITSHRNEIYVVVEVGLQRLERARDLGKVLVGEWLVDGYIVGSPAEMCCR